MGTARFLIWMTVFVSVWIFWNWLAPDALEVGQLPLHLPDPDPEPPGLVRRAADPARAEPPGGPRPGDRRAGPAGRRPRARRHGVPGPRGRLAADGRQRGRRPATTCARSCAPCSTSSTSARTSAARSRPATATRTGAAHRARCSAPMTARSPPPPRIGDHEHLSAGAGPCRARHGQRPRDQAAHHRPRHGRHGHRRRHRQGGRQGPADRRRLSAEEHHRARRHRRGDARCPASPVSTSSSA